MMAGPKTVNVTVILCGAWEDGANGEPCTYCGEPIFLRQFTVSIQLPTLGATTLPLLNYCQSCGETLAAAEIFQ
jgi:hypothetical protein